MKMKLLCFTRMLSIILLIGLVMPMFGQTEEQNRHPKFPEIMEHYNAYNNARQKGNYETAIKEAKIALDTAIETFGENDNIIANLYNVLGEAYRAKKEYETAIMHYNKAIAISQKISGENHYNIASSYNNMGLICDSKGEYDKAIEYYKKSIDIMLKTLGENHPNVNATYRNLVSSYGAKKEFDRALKIQKERAKNHPKYAELEFHFIACKEAKDLETFRTEMGNVIELEKVIFGEAHLRSVDNINHLGYSYYMSRKYKEAISLFMTALKIRIIHLGEFHPQIMESIMLIADTYKEEGKYDKAIEYTYKALDLRLKVFSEKHLDIAASYTSLGIIYALKGEYDEAVRYFNKSLEVKSEILGKEHPDVAGEYINLGNVYDSKGEYGEAIIYLNQSLEMKSKFLGNKHSDIAKIYNNLGSAYNSKGEYNKAIDYHNNALEIRLKLSEKDQLDVAESYNNLGIVYNSKGEYNKAIEYHKNALEIRVKKLGEYDRYVANSYYNLGMVYFMKEDYNSAIKYYNKALAIKLKVLGEEHPEVTTSYTNIGQVYYFKKNYEKSIEYINKSIKICIKVFGKENPHLASDYGSLGLIYYSTKAYKEAIEYINKSIEILIKAFGEEHPHIAGSFSNLGSVYRSKKEHTASIEYYNKAATIYKKSEDRTGYLSILNNLIGIYETLQKIPETIATLEEAVSVVLKARYEIVGRDKQAFTEKHIHFFEELVNLYNQTGQPEKAFEISEKMRGLSILENFQLQFALKESGVEQKVVTDVLNRKGKIESLYSEFSAVLRQGEKGQVYAKTLKEKILLEERELERVDRNLENSNPLYAKNRKIKIPDIKNLQTKLGESKKTLLEFTLSKDSEGKETLTAFVISKTKFDPVVLGAKLHLSLQINNLRQLISVNPDRRNLILAKTADNLDFLLGSSASEYQCKYKDDDERKKCEGFEEGTEIFKEEWNDSKEKLQSLDGGKEPQKVWKKFAVMERKILKEEATNTWLPFYLKEVYKTVIHPLYEKKLIETKEILISPDASLFTVPFSALLTPENQYWSENATISLIHSASIWMKLKETQKREYSQPIYAMGNPVYALSHSDTKGVRSSDLRAVSRGESMETLKLGNLKGSKEEMIFITKEIYKKEKSEHVKGGLLANKQELADNFAERKPIYKIVHFSAHGLFFPDAAELNSLALTSRAKAEKFKSDELKQYETSSKKKFPVDGFLKMGDVVDLGIKTDLIVMSACETSLGTERAGEGMVGLPQAFLIAGSQNTLATLWSVDDNGTTVFFKKFYNHYILAPNKLNSSKSLQKSQWETFGDKDKAKDKFKDPYFWAPFVVYGE